MERAADVGVPIPDSSPSGGESQGVARRTFLKAGLTAGLLVAAGGSWIPLRQALAQAESEADL